MESSPITETTTEQDKLAAPYFIDFEASSLDLISSYPIEVGLCMPSGKTFTWLLRPAPLWTDWSDEAERIHGINREKLENEGVNVIDVAHALNELIPSVVVCDALTYDHFWLYRLFKAAKIPIQFNLESVSSFLDHQQINNWAHIRREIIEACGLQTHRAGNDALILHYTWKKCQELG